MVQRILTWRRPCRSTLCTYSRWVRALSWTGAPFSWFTTCLSCVNLSGWYLLWSPLTRTITMRYECRWCVGWYYLAVRRYYLVWICNGPLWYVRWYNLREGGTTSSHMVYCFTWEPSSLCLASRVLQVYIITSFVQCRNRGSEEGESFELLWRAGPNLSLLWLLTYRIFSQAWHSTPLRAPTAWWHVWLALPPSAQFSSSSSSKTNPRDLAGGTARA